jgi:hypothetical protein
MGSRAPSDFVVTFVAGGPYGYAEGIGRRVRFTCPCGIAYHFDSKTNAARLFVGDENNRRVRAIDLASGHSTA